MENINPLYTSPRNNYIIVEQSDPLWQEVFGFTGCIYNISKFIDNNWTIIQSEMHLKDCFQWMQRMNIISKDEMLEQIRLLTKE